MAGDRRPARAHRRAARARTTSGRPARPGRAAPARSSTSTAALEFGADDDLPGRRQRALPRVLEPRVHAVRPGARDGHADAAAGQEHRHRPGAQPDGGRSSRTSTGLRDRPVRAADASWAASSASARRPTTRALRILADHSRGDDVPDRRRRRALQRGPRLRPAPGHAPGDPAGPPPRASSRGFLPALRRASSSSSWAAATPSCVEQRDAIAAWVARRGGGLRPHARAGHEAARTSSSTRAQATDAEGDRRRGRLPAARHLRLPVRPDARDRRRARAGGRRGRLRGADGRAARAARARAPRGGAGRRTYASAPRRSPGAPASRPSSPATRRSSSTRPSARVERRRRPRRSSSSPSRRSTPPAAARSPTPASSSARPATAARASPTSCAWATTRRSCVEAERRHAGGRASGSSPASTARRATPPRPTTPRPTCCTPRCASAWARTCARPAPTSAPTSCASTSPTASG